jgi:uncharacterized membrane protein YhaH (DUF805 family)
MLQLLTTFDGRISRKSYWIGGLLLLAILVVMFIVIGGAFAVVYALTGWSPPANSLAERLTVVVMTLIILPPGYALLRKRVNDLDHPPWTVLVSLGLIGLDLVANLLGGSYFQGVAMTVVGLLVTVNCLWAIAIGVIPGTAGPNRHGPDPLAPAA